ncbi:GNAT family N-acetyltransferase [Ruminococcaceae bacterium OttesenSCG-928-A16]|nr:GNAT family N-acetyltransferase [Ruminococcaceae bacterium OttesenSCG-928-A16]
MLTFNWIQGKEPAFADAAKVRMQVFVTEQGYSPQGELDEQDEASLHIIGYNNGAPVCTARLFVDADKESYHVGRVAVLPVMRGQGAGLQLMQRVEEKAKQLRAKRLVLSAQADKTYFYHRAGFSPTGVTTLDEGQPHAEMEKYLGK